MNTPWYLGNSTGFDGWPATIAVLVLWSIVWTGLALWHAAKRNDRGWFILFLVVHTVGILEILYLLFVVRIHHSPVQPKSRRYKK